MGTTGKLSEEQKTEIARRYEAGESGPALASEYSVHSATIYAYLTSADIPRRPPVPVGRLTEEQKVEIGRRYQAGEASADLAREYVVCDETIRKALHDTNIPVRPSSWAKSLLKDVSPQALRIAYEGPEQPSLALLAKRWGVSDSVLRRWLQRAGIQLRGLAEQQKIEYSLGRRRRSPKVNAAPQFFEASREWARRNPEAVRAYQKQAVKISGARRYVARIIRPCGWCGAPIARRPSEVQQSGTFACATHVGRIGNCRKQGKPLPALVEALQSAGTAARTWEDLEPIAQSLGAGEPEIECVLMSRFAVASTMTSETEMPAWLKPVMLEARG